MFLNNGMLSKRLHAHLLMLSGCFLSFAAVAVFVSLVPSNAFDRFFEQLFRSGPAALKHMMLELDQIVSPRHDLFAGIALSVMIAAGGAALHAMRSGLRDAVLFSGTTIACFALNILLKPIFARPRPDLSGGFSFPSEHAMMAFAFFIPLAFILSERARRRPVRALGWVAGGTLTLLIGLSRVCIHRHFMTDILGGYLLSGTVFLLFLTGLDLLMRSDG